MPETTHYLRITLFRGGPDGEPSWILGGPAEFSIDSATRDWVFRCGDYQGRGRHQCDAVADWLRKRLGQGDPEGA